MIFKTHKIDGKAAFDRKTFEAAIAEHERCIIDVREYSEESEISNQQQKWLHCPGGPIHYFTEMGWTQLDAKNHIKRKYGRQWFIKQVTPANYKTTKGQLYWECPVATCDKLIPIAEIFFTPSGRACPYCGSMDIRLVAIQSIMDRSVGTINKWITELLGAIPNMLPPDPEWRKSRKVTKK